MYSETMMARLETVTNWAKEANNVLEKIVRLLVEEGRRDDVLTSLFE